MTIHITTRIQAQFILPLSQDLTHAYRYYIHTTIRFANTQYPEEDVTFYRTSEFQASGRVTETYHGDITVSQPQVDQSTTRGHLRNGQ